jgi:hypothetical protein
MGPVIPLTSLDSTELESQPGIRMNIKTKVKINTTLTFNLEKTTDDFKFFDAGIITIDLLRR